MFGTIMPYLTLLISVIHIITTSGYRASLDSWSAELMRFQYQLQKDMDISRIQLIGTHNSLNSHFKTIDQHTFTYPRISPVFQLQPNQIYSGAEQYSSLGVRLFDISLSWIEDDFFVCYVSDEEAQAIQAGCSDPQFGWGLCSSVNIRDFGPSTGCSKNSYTLAQTLSILSGFIYSNTDEVIFVRLSTQKSSDILSLVDNAIQSQLGNEVFSPNDKLNFIDKWPSINDLLEMEKHIVIFGEESRFVHSASEWIAYSSNQENDFAATQFNWMYGDESKMHIILEDEIRSADSPIDSSNSMDLLERGFSLLFDRLDAERIQSTLWSFGEKFTTSPVINQCVHLDSFSGRWTNEKCEKVKHFACVNQTDSGDWLVSSSSSEFITPEQICPLAFSFSTPLNAFQNKKLLSAMETDKIETVWLSINSINEPACWRVSSESKQCIHLGVEDSSASVQKPASSSTVTPTDTSGYLLVGGIAGGFIAIVSTFKLMKWFRERKALLSEPDLTNTDYI